MRSFDLSLIPVVPRIIMSEEKPIAYPPKKAADGSSTETLTQVRLADDAVYATGGGQEYYRPIPEYEGAHRYDPKIEWTEQEEKALIRRVRPGNRICRRGETDRATQLDWRICAWVCLMFFALQLDRGNIAQALSDNMLNDLGLSTNDYNYGMTIFYVSFLAAELPSQMISKKLGPDVWIPIQMVSWSVVAVCQCQLNSRSTFYLTRALLGLIEGGFIPDVVLYLSYFYKSKELPIRLSFFWGAYISTNIVSAFMAFGILRMRGIHGWPGWRWLFALEGALTALIGIASWFYLPPSPTQTKSWFRGKDGWFSEREEKIMVNRILRDDPGKVRSPPRPARCLRVVTDTRRREGCTTAKASARSCSGRRSATLTSGPFIS